MWTAGILDQSDPFAGLTDQRLCLVSGHALERPSRGGRERTAALFIGRLARIPFYTDRERAALAWTEAVTVLNNGHVPDEIYKEVRPFFNDKELSDLTLAVAVINSWNRLNIAARNVPGDYRPARPYRVEKSA